MNTLRSTKSLMALLIFSSSFFMTFLINVRTSMFTLNVDIGQPTYAQPSRWLGRGILAILGVLGTSFIQSASDAAVAAVLDDSDEYVGSAYTATVYLPEYGRNVEVNLFQNSEGQWYVYFDDGTWEAIDPPTVQVYQIADVYETSSGEYYWKEP